MRAGGCGACGDVPQIVGNSLHAPRQPGYVRRSVSTLPQKGSHPCAGVRGWRLEAPCEPGADPEFDEHCASPCSTAAPPNPSTCSVPLSWMYDPRRATARTRVPAPASRPVPPGAAPRRRSLGIEQRRVGPERRGGTVGGFCSRKHQANQARARPVFAAAVTAAPTSAPRRRVRGVPGRADARWLAAGPLQAAGGIRPARSAPAEAPGAGAGVRQREVRVGGQSAATAQRVDAVAPLRVEPGAGRRAWRRCRRRRSPATR